MNECLDKQVFYTELKRLGLPIDDVQMGRFERYAELLCEWNEKMNLTSVCDPYGIAVTHFADSLTLLNAVKIKVGANVIDVGTGAGFPAIPLKIMRNDLKITLLDSLNKRLVFLNEVLKELGIEAETIHMRAEESARDLKIREKFDFATARAVAALPKLCEYCMPLVKTGGIFAAMKGSAVDSEVDAAKDAIKILGGSEPSVKYFTLNDESKRGIVLIKKINITPSKYPRQGGIIQKSPL